MKSLFTAALIALASPVMAGGWYFEASLEGGAEFWTFTNATGDVSPRRKIGDEIWIIRSDEVNELGADGACTFDNCAVKVLLGGQVPAARERVQITFSNGETLEFEARGGEVLFDNYSTAGMGATALFVENVRAAEWVEVGFGGHSHRFSLVGSAKALDAIRAYLRQARDGDIGRQHHHMIERGRGMARFLVWSDLHDEFWGGFDLPDLSAPVDGVLIAGDTHTRGRHLEIPARAARKYDCPVVVIWGNHEAYGSVWAELLADEERQLAELRTEGLDIRVLHGAATEIAGVRIIGATLWTDLRLYPEIDALARIMVSAYMQDYRAIRTAPDTRFTIDDMLECHARDKAAILAALRAPYEGPTVVMTHHLPLRALIAPWRTIGGNEKRAMNNGFACDLWDEIRGLDIDTWIWGHSHEGESRTFEGDHGPIRFVTNQRGYPGEELAFDPAFVLEV